MSKSSVVSFSVLALILGLLNPSTADAKRRRQAKVKAPVVATADAEQLNELKQGYEWGMDVKDVVKQVEIKVKERYEPRLKKTRNDPTSQARIRKEMRDEIAALGNKVVKFDGKTSGYDVSIIDREFGHGANESMLMAKDDNSTRYFFFVDGRLYKIFIAFDKSLIGDRSFEEFGDLMQERFGKTTPVFVEIERKEEKFKVLDHFAWRSKSGDGLHLVDRSQFYDVFCLVVFDGKKAEAQKAVWAKNAKSKHGGDSLVRAALSGQRYEEDVNANVLDRLSGTKHYKPGEAPPEDIVVDVPAKSVPKKAVKSPPKKNDDKKGAGDDDLDGLDF